MMHQLAQMALTAYVSIDQAEHLPDYDLLFSVSG
jgi:hypothetical protein